ncbi:helix-turn-helix transcriptional regulator [Streptomyces sp. A3M-1-3]|uniref:MmyB family transcriptional regulator n=1 Tax=Streptomyces sp. A3M-1-3 TaxID=2962044 RepID=UPI0020B73388|nr:helix-turn-helix domain-containing protein [Streptomyces sp. A3M-1-3]MCP3821853.1 helix-turn-helix transcriptional regulator [Streptomyces sp. A3M-1-3]
MQLIVTRILRQARARRNTSDIPGFVASFGDRSSVGITQAQTAQLAGVSRRWYNALESGRPKNYSDNFLQAVRRILDLSTEEWDIVYRITRGRVPNSAPVSPLSGLLPDAIRDLVEQSPTWALYVNDHRWDVLAYNAKTREYFPWIRHGLNVMEWALTWPEARAQLIDWQDEWALPMIAQLRLHAEQWPQDARLQAVIGTVMADPIAGKLWNAPNLPAITHPASHQPRRLYLPRQGGKEFAIRLLPFTPMELPSCRLMAITPVK